MEKVAQQAGKAAPAMAIAGALVAAPQAQHVLAASARPLTVTAHQTAAQATGATAPGATTPAAKLDAFATRAVTVAAAQAPKHAALASVTEYQVRSGDTLSGIAERFYKDASDWQYLYHENDKTISDPNLIYPGQSLEIPASVPPGYTLSSYVPKHAASTPTTPTTPTAPATPVVTATNQDSQPAQVDEATGGSADTAPAPAGDYTCSGLEQLWEQAGGNPDDAFMAAEIAMAESSGDPNAISPTDDYGLWQINASNGSLATLNPFDNAKSAIILSDDGTNWNPWTTYHTGAYYGKC